MHVSRAGTLLNRRAFFAQDEPSCRPRDYRLLTTIFGDKQLADISAVLAGIGTDKSAYLLWLAEGDSSVLPGRRPLADECESRESEEGGWMYTERDPESEMEFQ